MKLFRFTAAIFVIAGMIFQGLAESWLWFITLTTFLGGWIFLEKYLDEIIHREFWQDLCKEQSRRHGKNT